MARQDRESNWVVIATQHIQADKCKSYNIMYTYVYSCSRVENRSNTIQSTILIINNIQNSYILLFGGKLLGTY